MNLQEKLSGLKLPALARGGDVAEDERLLKLFWNRAELKKELQGLDDQLHGLRNRLKQQEGAHSRLQEQMEQLEILLGTPLRGIDALVHFGLRNLWRECRLQLEQFAGDLRSQRQDRERKKQLAEFQKDQAERLKMAEERLAEAEDVAQSERTRLQEGEQRLLRLHGFWNYFRRRDLAFELDAQRGRIAHAEQHLADLRDAQRTIQKEPLPEFPGVSIEGRRMINLAVIAYAQVLCARLTPSGLAAEARLANHRRVQEARHGSREDCLARLDEVAQAIVMVGSQEGLAPEIRERTERLKASVSWRTAQDVVPTPASVPPATPGDRGGNVLIDDYWDVYKTLQR